MLGNLTLTFGFPSKQAGRQAGRQAGKPAPLHAFIGAFYTKNTNIFRTCGGLLGF